MSYSSTGKYFGLIAPISYRSIAGRVALYLRRVADMLDNPFSGPGNSDKQRDEATERLKAEMEAARATEKGGIVGPIEPIVETVTEKLKEEMPHQKVLREHGGLESNIPLNHPFYWKVRP